MNVSRKMAINFKGQTAKVKIKNLVVIFIILLPGLSIINLSGSACEYSLQTVEPTTRCPSTRNEYDIAANRKNCNKFNHSCKSFQYHCVLNEWRTGLVEVCAPSKYIFGRQCSEFNNELKSIRRSYLTNCSTFDSPCPNPYNSSSGYMYPACYLSIIATTNRIAYLHTVQPSLNSTETYKNDNHRTTALETTHTIIIVIVATAFVLTVIIFLYIRKQIKNSQANKTSEDHTAREKDLLYLDQVEPQDAQ